MLISIDPPRFVLHFLFTISSLLVTWAVEEYYMTMLIKLGTQDEQAVIIHIYLQNCLLCEVLKIYFYRAVDLLVAHTGSDCPTNGITIENTIVHTYVTAEMIYCLLFRFHKLIFIGLLICY